ncbi:O-mycaminosyltylonolide 6-deoxyallosyltransferase [Methylobacterium crusticola]|uniref:O-mycaminosyltylonolide 6-deoxyallosyltransferase n=1 Tax=Methylobacterium crusticola TaxID=1697972 RepID=A0ABQ4R8H9_9HYPH|nr:glycosyltransferase [Methylobacterium crusticola]GJD53424.1 O-mycaminosyltylonolide 6-deoxyallosyltransferase [Methylobacterium crusticola]
MSDSPRRVLLVSFGTRGDVQPFCVLGRALVARGHAVRVVTTRDFAGLVRRFGLDAAEVGAPFAEVLRDPDFDGLFHGYFSAGLRAVPRLRALSRRLGRHLTDLMRGTLEEVRRADVVVYNPFAYFAGEFARESGRPSLAVLCQPMLPTGRESLSLLGGRDLGRLGNRLSYESLRLLGPLMRRPVGALRREGAGRGLRLLTNPVTRGLAEAHPAATPFGRPPAAGAQAGPARAGSHAVLAYSAALSPPAPDWPVPATQTGFWFADPEPGAALPEAVERFLGQGPPPVFIGFGSMLWGARRNTEVVRRALELWGGRAIVAAGAGGLALPPSGPDGTPAGDHAPAQDHGPAQGHGPAQDHGPARDRAPPGHRILTVGALDHALVFPRVAAVVHHGGAGTTAAALRAGRPNVILPMLGDQLYWGRRVAAVGAGEAPVPLAQVTPEELARRIAQACAAPRARAAAAAVAAAMAREPGVAAAADLVDWLSGFRDAA